jgi:hypothetical protein
MNATLPRKPEKGRPCTMSFDVAVPPLPGGVILTFALRGDGQAYRLPPPSTMTVSAEGGRVQGQLVATPLVAVQCPKGKSAQGTRIEPALWLDCHYTLGGTAETFSRPITVVRRSILGWLLGGE